MELGPLPSDRYHLVIDGNSWAAVRQLKAQKPDILQKVDTVPQTPP